MGINELAALMEVTEADAQGFVDCLRVWTDKGYSLDGAISQNLAAWATLLDRVNDGVTNELSRHKGAVDAMIGAAVDAFYPAEVSA